MQYHDEYMEVPVGHIAFTLEGRGEFILGPEDPPFHIPKWRAHSFKCFPGEKATLKEKTDPAGDFKEQYGSSPTRTAGKCLLLLTCTRFFRNLLMHGQLSFLRSMQAFYDGDTYLALPGHIKIIDQAVCCKTVEQEGRQIWALTASSSQRLWGVSQS